MSLISLLDRVGVIRVFSYKWLRCTEKAEIAQIVLGMVGSEIKNMFVQLLRVLQLVGSGNGSPK